MSKLLELTLDVFEELYCPVCGKQVFPMDKICEHVLFIYSHSLGECVHGEETWGKKIESMLDTTECITVEELFENFETPDTSFILTITTSGMGCGPCSNTDYICFDFEPETA